MDSQRRGPTPMNIGYETVNPEAIYIANPYVMDEKRRRVP
jgi:hypothetical protein